MELQQKTRLGVSPGGRSRLYLAFAEADAGYAKDTVIEQLLSMQDCAVYYTDTPDTAGIFAEELGRMQLLLVLFTPELAEARPLWLTELLRRAEENHLPVLPLLRAPVSLDRFEAVFGQVQFLPLYRATETELPFAEKLEKALSHYLIGDETQRQILSAFRRRIFLSYRKVDRARAQALMRHVHDLAENLDVGIWYDEQLTVGNQYNREILSYLRSGDLFLLVMTPHVLEKAENGEENYVVSIELPEAFRQGKDVLAVEMEPTVPEWPERLGLGPEQTASEGDAGRKIAEMLGSSAPAEFSPEKRYLLGLAYLGGVLVETNLARGADLVESAARQAHLPAMQKMYELCRYGIGRPRDPERGFDWLGGKWTLLLQEYETQARAEDTWSSIGHAVTELKILIQECLDGGLAKEAIRFTRFLHRLCGLLTADENEMTRMIGILEDARATGYLGDARMRQGDSAEGLRLCRGAVRQGEDLLSYISEQVEKVPLLKLYYLPMEKRISEMLLVCYDHLADYLIQAGLPEEAETVRYQSETLLQSGRPVAEKEALQARAFAAVRKAQSYEKAGQMALAEKTMEQAASLLEQTLALSENWALRLQMATVLNWLARQALGRSGRDLDEAALSRAEARTGRALDLCEACLRYNPNDGEALREKSICLELRGRLHFCRGNLEEATEANRACEALRQEILDRFPSEQARQDLQNAKGYTGEMLRVWCRQTAQILAMKHRNWHGGAIPNDAPSRLFREMLLRDNPCGSRNYLPGTFTMTDSRTPDGERRVLAPTETTRALLSQLFPGEEAPERLDPACRTIYTAPIRPVLQFTRRIVFGAEYERYNMALSNIGAELLLGVGAENPDHTLFLYQIVDSQYQTYLVLLSSMVATEAKVLELCAAGLLTGADWWDPEGRFCVTGPLLDELVRVLGEDYFRLLLRGSWIVGSTPILALWTGTDTPMPTGHQLSRLDTREGNARFCYMLKLRQSDLFPF